MKNGEVHYAHGSAAKPYEMKLIDGVYSCNCMAWTRQSLPIDVRTCKHLVSTLGVEVERARVGDGNMPTKFRNGAKGAPAPKVRKTPTPTAPAKSPGCGCEDGKVCDVSHDPATCPCVQCTTAEEAARKKAAQVLLAESWDGDMDPTGWWVSIKKDGLRAIWDGQEFLSRNGNVFYAHPSFKSEMPPRPLDGELYLGKDMFEETMSIVRSYNGGDKWKKVKYVIFDAPDHPGTFEERIAFLKTLVLPPHAEVLDHARCAGKAQLLAELDRVTAQNEEGLMLRKPHSRYERRRSSTLLKVKKFFDTEVTVTGHTQGKGKHKGRLGALVVRSDDGKTFNIGTGFSDADRESPPPVGSRVAITFTTRTRYGIPKCAAFLRVRQPE